MNPRVSVVVPAFNNGDFIEATMRSILGQGFDDFEVIVADHASTDDTWDKLGQFAGDPRVTLLRTDAGGGARRNWNRVTEAATGDYIKLVCGDDLLAPQAVQRELAAFDDDVVLVASSRHIVDASLRPVVSNRGLGGLRGKHPGAVAIRRTVRSGTNIFGEPACVMMRRSALISQGMWADEEYLIDEATYVNVLHTGAFVAVPEPLASFRLSSTQWSVKLVREQADQAIRFHRSLRDSHPGLLSRLDIALGNARARLNAWGRRAIYAWLGRRMTREVN